MTPPKVTVCLVTYNQENYLRSCLQSVVDQTTNFPFEVLVADDRSTDDTRSIITEFASRFPELVRPILRPVNIGAMRNFVETHNAASADYVAHIDGDDLMLPGKLQKQADFLDANPDFTVVWHRVNLFDDQGGFIPGESFDTSFYPNGTVTLEHSLRLGSVAAHSSIMYRRSARKTTEVTFDVIDLFYTWEYLSAGKGKILSDVLGSYRVAASGSMQLQGISQIQKILAHHAHFYLQRMPSQKRNIFSLAFINFLVDMKNRRPSAWDFAKVAIKSFSLLPPQFLLRNLQEMRRLPGCSPIGRASLAKAPKNEPQVKKGRI